MIKCDSVNVIELVTCCTVVKKVVRAQIHILGVCGEHLNFQLILEDFFEEISFISLSHLKNHTKLLHFADRFKSIRVLLQNEYFSLEQSSFNGLFCLITYSEYFYSFLADNYMVLDLSLAGETYAKCDSSHNRRQKS